MITVLLSEYHEMSRSRCRTFLELLGQLNSVAHQWVLHLLADNMHQADSKPQYCLEYYDTFCCMVMSLPKQSLPVSLNWFPSWVCYKAPKPCQAPNPTRLASTAKWKHSRCCNVAAQHVLLAGCTCVFTCVEPAAKVSSLS